MAMKTFVLAITNDPTLYGIGTITVGPVYLTVDSNTDTKWGFDVQYGGVDCSYHYLSLLNGNAFTGVSANAWINFKGENKVLYTTNDDIITYHTCAWSNSERIMAMGGKTYSTLFRECMVWNDMNQAQKDDFKRKCNKFYNSDNLGVNIITQTEKNRALTDKNAVITDASNKGIAGTSANAALHNGDKPTFLFGTQVNECYTTNTMTVQQVAQKIYDLVEVTTFTPKSINEISLNDIPAMSVPPGAKVVDGGRTETDARVFIKNTQTYRGGGEVTEDQTYLFLPQSTYDVYNPPVSADLVDVEKIEINSPGNIKVYLTMPTNYPNSTVNIQQVRIWDRTWGMPAAGYNDKENCEFHFGNYTHNKQSNGGGKLLSTSNNSVEIYSEAKSPTQTKPSVLLVGHEYDFIILYQVYDNAAGEWCGRVETSRIVHFLGYPGGNPVSSGITFTKHSSSGGYRYNASIGCQNIWEGFANEWCDGKNSRRDYNKTDFSRDLPYGYGGIYAGSGELVKMYQSKIVHQTGHMDYGSSVVGYGSAGTETDLIETGSYYMPVKWHR
ncbi:MAG: hypothetical protein KAS32_31650 [Candidatus Peribacteraceae bacterium]|nr:hypothetical protein [Candidatus Peribacteraceae bacterium]